MGLFFRYSFAWIRFLFEKYILPETKNFLIQRNAQSNNEIIIQDAEVFDTETPDDDEIEDIKNIEKNQKKI